jgi:CysZ protein
VAVVVWSDGIAAMDRVLPSLPWSGWELIARWAAVFLLLAGFATLTYVTALMLVAVVALPLLITTIAARDYPDLVRRGENVFIGSLANTVGAGLVFIVGGLATLPLLLIPGVILVLPLAWAAWLNQRTFRFDALAEHATRAELKQLVSEQRGIFLGAGIGTAILAHVPLLNILAPTFTAVVFVHLCLGALRRLRSTQGVQL